MNLPTLLLVTGGAVGAITAIVHGVLLHRSVIPPLIGARGGPSVPAPSTRRLVVAVMQFSTFAWITGGLLLIVSALLLPQPARLSVGVLVGSQFLYGALGNFVSLRRWHPGWVLMSIAVVAIALGIGLDFNA